MLGQKKMKRRHKKLALVITTASTCLIGTGAYLIYRFKHR